jgi:hypothetical protein
MIHLNQRVILATQIEDGNTSVLGSSEQIASSTTWLLR